MQHAINLQQELGIDLVALALLAEGIPRIKHEVVAVWISCLYGVYKTCSTSKSTFRVLSAAWRDFAPRVACIDQRELELIGPLFHSGDAQEDPCGRDQTQQYGDVPILTQPSHPLDETAKLIQDNLPEM